MFSGKSSELARRIRRMGYAKKSCVVIKYAKDVRYSETEAATHDKIFFPAISALALENVKSAVRNFDVIGIDECQFFNDVVEFAEEMANEGKVVICAGLDSTFQRKSFGRMLELIPLAEQVTKLTAVCMLCGAEAAFSKRIGSETEVEVIGGSEKYVASCRKCFFHSGNDIVPTKRDAKLRDSVSSVSSNDL